MKFHPTRPAMFALAFSTTLALLILLLPLTFRPAPPPIQAQAALSENYGKLPLHFEANQGQVAAPVKFLARGQGYALALMATEAVLQLRTAPASAGGKPNAEKSTTLRLRLPGAKANPHITGLDELPGQTNYFSGSDPSQWRTGIANYARVKVSEVYPGVDLIYYGQQRQLEYDIIVQPAADPRSIALQFEGADKLEIDARGDLLLHTAGGTLRQRKPIVYQETVNGRTMIDGRYAVKDEREIGFVIGAYDHTLPLVIDPVLSYATYLGGNQGDSAASIAVDADGNAYVTGFTTALDFPTVNPFQATPNHNNPGNLQVAFVTKLNAAGTAFVYSTYLGSPNTFGNAIAVDSSGHAYVTGVTSANNFPTTPGAFVPAGPPGGPGPGGSSGPAGFVTKLSATGAALIYSTYITSPTFQFAGPGCCGTINGIKVDDTDHAYLVGQSNEPSFPVTPGAFHGPPAEGSSTGKDTFVIRLAASGSALLYSTFLGGVGAGTFAFPGGLALDPAGNVYVTGQTTSTTFPTTPGAYQTTFHGMRDAFVTKLNPTGTGLVYSTLLGGSGSDEGHALALDATGNTYITGVTNGADFPTTPGAFRPFIGGDGGDAFLAKLNATGTALVYSTYLGNGIADRSGTGVAVDGAGNAYVTGSGAGNSNGGYLINALTPTPTNRSAFLLKLNPAGTALGYATLLGGNTGSSVANALTLDAAGNAYVTGATHATDFPVTPGAAQGSNHGGDINAAGSDAFILKLSAQAGDCPALTINPQPLAAGFIGVPYSQPLTATGGTAPYTFDFYPGLGGGFSFCTGLTLSSAGLISGTPGGCALGTITLNLRVTAANGCVGVRPYQLVFNNCPSITVNPPTLPNGTAGTAYNQTLSASGGGAPYGFAVTGGSLPNGLALAAGGALTGTPTLVGNFNFTVTATDANGCTGTRAYAVTIVCPTVAVQPAALPNGTTGQAYNQTITATGGTAPYTFAVTTGALPNGLSLASGGALTGTPALISAGTYNFTVTATDNTGCTGTRAYTVIISGNGLLFYALPAPVRLLETRAGFTGCTMPGVPINANGTLTLPARTTCAGIPAAAAAVTGNITVVPSGPGFLTLFPSSAAQPTVANSNFQTNEITNNVFTVGLGASDGAFKIFSSATTHVIVDVTGYYAPPNTGGLYFHPLATPVRLLETRVGFTGCITPGTQLIGTGNQNADPNLDLLLQGRSPVAAPCNSIPATAQVLVGNATSVLPNGGGYLTIYPSGGTRPTVASSNYAGGDVINGPFAVKLGADGKFKIYTFATTHLVVDILGYYSEDATDANGAGLLFNPLPSPVRLLETRAGFNGCTMTGAPIVGNLNAATHTQMAANFCSLPASAQAVVGNVSVVNTTGAGFLTLFPANLTTAPLVATSNYPAPATFGYNRHYFVGLSPADGKFKVLTQFTTDLILDASGYFAP